MSSKRSQSNRSSALNLNTKPTIFSSKDTAFKQELIDNSVYPLGYDNIKPGNLEEIIEKLRQPRVFLSPSKFSCEDFVHFRRKNNKATTEAEATIRYSTTLRHLATISQTHSQTTLMALARRRSVPKCIIILSITSSLQVSDTVPRS